MDKFEALKRPRARDKHGQRSTYMRGCRCLPCRAANSSYASRRAVERLKGNGNACVSAEPVRRHLVELQRAGVGYKHVAKVAKVSRGIVQGVRKGTRKHIREQNARRLLAVKPQAKAGAALVPAGPTRARLKWLIEEAGFTRTALAKLLGSRAKNPKLQFHRSKVLARTAHKVRTVYEYYR